MENNNFKKKVCKYCGLTINPVTELQGEFCCLMREYEYKEIYNIRVVCNNCDFKDNMNIIKGNAIEDQECPKCGCKKLIRHRGMLHEFN